MNIFVFYSCLTALKEYQLHYKRQNTLSNTKHNQKHIIIQNFFINNSFSIIKI